MIKTMGLLMPFALAAVVITGCGGAPGEENEGATAEGMANVPPGAEQPGLGGESQGIAGKQAAKELPQQSQQQQQQTPMQQAPIKGKELPTQGAENIGRTQSQWVTGFGWGFPGWGGLGWGGLGWGGLGWGGLGYGACGLGWGFGYPGNINGGFNRIGPF